MISSWPILSIITFLPLCGALFAFFIPSKNDESTNINYNQNIKLLALWTSIMTLIISLLICINFDYEAKDYQFEEISPWIPSLGIMYHLGIDGISTALSIEVLEAPHSPSCLAASTLFISS